MVHVKQNNGSSAEVNNSHAADSVDNWVIMYLRLELP